MKAIADDQKCQCYFCFATFRYDEIEEWTDLGRTAICPNCNVDAVLFEMVGQIKLQEMFEKSFTGRFRPSKERLKEISDGCERELKKFDSPGKV